ncbi:TonB-dependent receptor plug domain-containing protein [Brumicola nitratireducens]|uniref:TonB-dependent outer membrane receptor n=1 Tax=Glaciecola nitratireducens (strain JCM 12485 / KCTC 12276 / FR1064) TaxID=1085623 RepID=G4QNR6_GLANF|nr:TonB-dependent receptor [Glaciecola nitratireducens]AEP31624.1 TonB-dependent outer membrane receptor [Glaciecola nitratireducens FR1064]
MKIKNAKLNCHKKNKFSKKTAIAMAISLPLMTTTSIQSFAQEQKAEDTVEKVIVTGTRMMNRSAADSPVPVDIISGDEFRQNSSADVQDMLRTAVPSFNVNSQPISDAATIVRPANLRGLSPDNVLVLVNGKRRHRGSIISFLGGGISDGAQGVDISAIPSMALKQVEVLRDGASSQYGSDAIAGVLNFILKDESEGFEVVARYGSTYEGDGDNYTIAANAGLPLGDSGFVNLTAEIKDVEGTVRSVVRSDVAGMIDGGYLQSSDFLEINSYTGEVPQYWGTPDVEGDVKLFINSAYEINDKAELYLFGNYGEREVTGGFFYRNPVTEGSQRGGVYAGPKVNPATGLLDPNGVHSVLVGDLDGGSSCIDGIPINGVIPDAGFLADVAASDNCFSFITDIPNGFVPRFGGNNEDQAITVGVRGELSVGTGLSYDLSAQRGSNKTEFFIRNTINASLGPATPRDFVPGGQEQTETQFNVDFVYRVDAGFESELNIAFGAEYREEEFDLFAGDAASFALGPLASQGFSSSSNGFGGFPRDTSASQDSTAFYVDVETDITEQLTLAVAVRTEEFSEFGNTTDFKVASIFHVSDDFRIRGAISTGFHAPTAGQANITNVTTQNVQGVLVDQGTLPLSSAAGQLGADFIASAGNGRPSLGPEEANNFSIGVGFDVAGSVWTIDYYNIELTDRVSLGANVDFLDALNFTGGAGSNFATVSEALTTLDAQGVIDRQQFVGLDDLSEFRFFSNSFSTTTTGIDIVGNYSFDMWGGDSRLTVAANYNKTEVDSVGTINPISAGRVAAIEDLLPTTRANISWSHTEGQIRTLLRANYYGGWDDTGNGVNGIGAEVLIDAQVAYQFNDQLEFVVGVDNLLDAYPEENPGAGGSGQLYSESSPFGFNGGTWYLQARYTY